MAHVHVPHFHNTEGLKTIRIGAKEFMCIGALPPFDHPHIFLDMGRDSDVICSYCSTHYVYDPALPQGSASPASAIYEAAGV